MLNEEYLPEYVRMCLQSTPLRNAWKWNYGDKYYDPATDSANFLNFMHTITSQCIPLPSLEQLHRLLGGNDVCEVAFHSLEVIKDMKAS